jgi:hypothetical protein
VSIYILGHKVGKIKEPVVYVSRKYLDYDSKEITEGVPDPFVESLTHDSIIVQVPYLKGKARNRVEKLLSVFDQTYVQDGDPQFVSVSDRDISEDKDMERIINRLAKAATISDIRMTMNIEDEIYSELENLDTKILSQKKALGQKDKQLAHQEEQLAHQEKQLTQQKELLRNTIKMLLETGKTPSEIADNLHLDIDDVNELI